MPFVNRMGDVIMERADPKPYLRYLVWPKDKSMIAHLDYEDLKDWLLGLPQKEAFILAGTFEVNKIIESRRKRGLIGYVYDWFWRWIRGLDY